jgi:aspartokinase-like uncharacterized kinase
VATAAEIFLDLVRTGLSQAPLSSPMSDRIAVMAMASAYRVVADEYAVIEALSITDLAVRAIELIDWETGQIQERPKWLRK